MPQLRLRRAARELGGGTRRQGTLHEVPPSVDARLGVAHALALFSGLPAHGSPLTAYLSSRPSTGTA
jgi:hypothetical protein